MHWISRYSLLWIGLCLLLAPVVTVSGEESRGLHRVPLTATTQDGSALSLYEGSYALLVGVSRYTSWSQLENIPTELDAVQQALEQQSFHVERLMDPESEQLEDGINSFIEEYGYDEGNRLLIYFSGHGYSEKNKGYLVPADAAVPDEWREFRRKALPMSRVMAWARDIESKHVLFMFDSCFSGSVFKAKDIPRPGERYVRQATAKPVRQFITAGSANEVVPAKSTFTPAFVDAINGAGDLNDDGFVTGTELGVHLSQLVPNYVNQTPQYGKIREYELSQGDFVFFSGKSANLPDSKSSEPERQKEEELRVAELPSGMLDLEFYREAEKLGTRGAYQAYLEEFPSGRFVRLIKLKLAGLEARETQEREAEEAARLAQEQEEERVAAEPARLQVEQQAKKAAEDFALKSEEKRALVESELNLSRSTKREVQQALNHLGFEVGSVDGFWGVKTRAGLRLWQKSIGAEDHGYVNDGDIKRLLGAVPAHIFSNVQEPQMIRIPAGRFSMGSNKNDREIPVHSVSIKAFELAIHEVTLAEFSIFVESTGYETQAERNITSEGCLTEKTEKGELGYVEGRNWKNPGFVQTGSHPVVCISWNDAQRYIEWLNNETGGNFRLPSESEWEYAARAGTSSSYSFGKSGDLVCEYGNAADKTLEKVRSDIDWSSLDWKVADCEDGYVYSAPVGSYKANGFGVKDMHGNVMEWVQDCWHQNYKGAPTTEKPWLEGEDCDRRVIRGGSAINSLENLRSAVRFRTAGSDRAGDKGFRLARTLTP